MWICINNLDYVYLPDWLEIRSGRGILIYSAWQWLKRYLTCLVSVWTPLLSVLMITTQTGNAVQEIISIVIINLQFRAISFLQTFLYINRMIICDSKAVDKTGNCKNFLLQVLYWNISCGYMFELSQWHSYNEYPNFFCFMKNNSIVLKCHQDYHLICFLGNSVMVVVPGDYNQICIIILTINNRTS